MKKHVLNDGQLTATSLFTKGSVISCVYCDQNHQSSSCKVMTDVETRKQQLQKTGRCFMFSHGMKLPFRPKCSNCNGQHHVSICQRKESLQALLVPGRHCGLCTSTTSMYTSARTPILLQTVRTHVWTNSPNCSNVIE